ncbi:WecB/TagA/CpsF family glycosyltransferase [Rhodococcus fascians]|nr:WecB/TagA/CpsF family glycosyltransferase [Rhodococcus fascians]
MSNYGHGSNGSQNPDVWTRAGHTHQLFQGAADSVPARVKIDLLGITVDPMRADQIVEVVLDAVAVGRSLWISNFNLHAAYLYNSEPTFKAHSDSADLHVIDGWPILVAARCSSGITYPASFRVGSSDWLELLFASRTEIEVVAIGASSLSSRKAASLINDKFGCVTWRSFDGFDLQKTDDLDGPVRWEEAVAQSTLVLVGMGMPHQEQWIVDNRHLLEGKVIANIGGCIDYISGEQELAPRWLGNYGLEWAYRLVRSPRRLSHRYLIEPLLLIRLIIQHRRRGSAV